MWTLVCFYPLLTWIFGWFNFCSTSLRQNIIFPENFNINGLPCLLQLKPEVFCECRIDLVPFIVPFTPNLLDRLKVDGFLSVTGNSSNREKELIVMANTHGETQDILLSEPLTVLYLRHTCGAQTAFPLGFAELINDTTSDLLCWLTPIVCYSSVNPSGTVCLHPSFVPKRAQKTFRFIII